MTRHYGRAPRGERAHGSVPDNPGPNITLVMGLGLRGVVAPFRFEGAMDGNAWDQYVEKQLAPCLRKGDIVVVDGLGAHRTRASRTSVRKRGGKYWKLPGYSPDFSPVENAGGKVKTLIRGEEARDREALDEAMKKALSRVSRGDAREWFRLKGYVPPRKGRRRRKRAKPSL